MKLSKLHLTKASLAVGASFIPSAFGFTEFARGNLVANASLVSSYDTNIFGNSSEVDDFNATFSPGLSYLRDAGNLSVSIESGVSAVSFADSSSQDSVDPFLNTTLNLDRAEKGSATVSLGYTRSTEANNLLLARTQSDEYRSSGRVNYFYSEKTGIRVDANFRRSEYNTFGYNSISSYGLGGGLIYRYSSKLTASATYDFSPEKAINLAGPLSDPSSKNHRFAFGLEGQLAPKLNGSVSLGYAYRSFDLGGSDDTALLGVDLLWNPVEKSSFTLSASNNFDTTAGAESARILDVSLGGRQALTEKLVLGGSLGYQHSQIDQKPGPVSRSDDAYLLGVSLSYALNDNWSTNAGITHRLNKSSLALGDYVRTVVSAGVNLSF